MLRAFQLSFFILVAIPGYSQDSVLPCDSVGLAPIRAYFEGFSHKYENKGIESFRMERSYFRKDFELSLTDSSYKVVRFHVVAHIDNGLVSMWGKSKRIEVNDEHSKLLSRIVKNGIVAVDNIIVSKNGQCYRVPSFICYFIK
jgi:hypothetical protein